MKYRPARELRVGRLFVHGLRAADLALPRLTLCVDGPDLVSVGASYGVEGHDPFLLLELDLSGTRAGHVVAELEWRLYRLRQALRDAAPP